MEDTGLKSRLILCSDLVASDKLSLPLSPEVYRAISRMLLPNYLTKSVHRNIWRFGYEDKLKMSGTLPRIGNDYARVPSKKIFKPQNPFAPSNALYGQNDYFDILGKRNTAHINDIKVHGLFQPKLTS